MRRLAFRLALRFGELDVDAMLARIPLSLFYEWAEYAELEILSDVALDAHLAHIRCTLANVHRDRRKHKLPFKLEEFLMLKSKRQQPRRQTPEQMKQVLKTMGAMHNAALEQQRGKKRS